MHDARHLRKVYGQCVCQRPHRQTIGQSHIVQSIYGAPSIDSSFVQFRNGVICHMSYHTQKNKYVTRLWGFLVVCRFFMHCRDNASHNVPATADNAVSQTCVQSRTSLLPGNHYQRTWRRNISIMGKLLFYSSALAITLELLVIPVIQKMLVDPRWSPFTFVGALLFLVASANVIHRNECLPQWLTSVLALLLSCLSIVEALATTEPLKYMFWPSTAWLLSTVDW